MLLYPNPRCRNYPFMVLVDFFYYREPDPGTRIFFFWMQPLEHRKYLGAVFAVESDAVIGEGYVTAFCRIFDLKI